MSEIEVDYGETAFFTEKSKLVQAGDKVKHAATTEKDDANLLSEGSSQEDDEEDLVLEYKDEHKTSGDLHDNVVFEDGESLTASDTEISAANDDNIHYYDSVTTNADCINNQTQTPADANDTENEYCAQKCDDISKIAQELSATEIDTAKKKAEVKDLTSPGIAEKIIPSDEHYSPTQSQKIERRNSSSSSLSDLALKKNLLSTEFVMENNENNELEWEEEYHIDTELPLKDNPMPHTTGEVKQEEQTTTDQDHSENDNRILNADSEPLSRNKNQNIQQEKMMFRGQDMNTSFLKEKKHLSDFAESEHISFESTQKEYNNTEALNSSSLKVNKSRPRKMKKKKQRHKIYLDDPDIHHCIADYALVLKRFANDVESGKYMPKIQNKLHPISRDDVIEVKGMKKNKKNVSSMSTLKAMDHFSDDESKHMKQTPSSHLGPYDGHGKRGRNLISRIKSDSQSSSSLDEDEETDSNVRTVSGRSSHRRIIKSSYDICEECGERHSCDEGASDGSDQEICPDCGVPHNPFQHPPSPSAKTKWRQYVEHCRNSMLQISNSSYQQVPQDPPEPAKEDDLPNIEGPHTKEELTAGARYKMKYLGTTQVATQHPVTKETRMQQAQEAFYRIKVADDEVQPATQTEMIISLERLKVVNCEGKHEDVMMDHALRTVCFICDMGNILVLMSRRLTTDQPDLNMDEENSVSLSKIIAERERRTSKNICHIFECDEAQKVSKAIGQAFNMAYRQFLKSNGISHDNVEEAEYCHVLESQKIVGQDLDILTDRDNSRDIVIQKKRSEALGIMLLESGWGSMLPTVFIAHIANYSPAARLGGQLGVGDHVLACNGASLVGLPLSECNQILRNTRSSARVVLKIVSCPPVVDVVVSRPDTKYQLGFSVQNGTICSLLRGGIAERGGVRVGHRIIEINGESVVAKTHQHIVDMLANTSGEISMKTLPVAMYRLMVGIDAPTHV